MDVSRKSIVFYTRHAYILFIWKIKWENEDLSFRFLEHETYKDIARKLEERRVEREGFIKQVVDKLSTALRRAGIDAQVTGRPKHIYSIWNKMRNKQLDFNQQIGRAHV